MEIEQIKLLKHLIGRKKKIYLDNNATTSVPKDVRKAINHVLRSHYGNPSSNYTIAREAASIREEARRHVAQAIGTTSDEVYFTSCASESNNTVLLSMFNQNFPKKNKIISSPIEHPSVLNTLQFLESQGVEVCFCPVDSEGRIVIEELDKMLDSKTFLVCSILASNEIGTIQNISAITTVAHSHNIPVLVDCVQAFGKIPIQLHDWDVDFASFSAHKLHGPKGIGALYVKNNLKLTPLIYGGQQEKGLRAGTECLHNIAGFGQACKNVNKLIESQHKTSNLKALLLAELYKSYPALVENSPKENCLPNTLNLTFPDIDRSQLMTILDFHGIAISAGSACSHIKSKPSRVLKAIGLDDEHINQSVRISLGNENTLKDIRFTAKIFSEFFDGKFPVISNIPATQLSNWIEKNDPFILDVRSRIQRRKKIGLPNANGIPYVKLNRNLHRIPKKQNVLVYCQKGNISLITAFYLRTKGYPNVYNLTGGIINFKTNKNNKAHH